MTLDNRLIGFLLSFLGIIIALVFASFIGGSEYVYLFGGLAIFAGIFFVVLPYISVFAVICLYSSGLTAPGLPGQMELYHVAAVGIAARFVLLFAFRQVKLDLTSAKVALIGFCLVLVMISSERGLGFQFLGSSLWGGMNYAKLWLMAALVITLPQVNMPRTWWPKAFIIMGFLAILPVAGDYLAATGRRYFLLQQFLSTGVSVEATAMEMRRSGNSLVRFYTAGLAAAPMLLALLCVTPTKKFFSIKGIVPILLFTAIICLSLLSGFRLITATLFGIVGLTCLLQKTLTFPRALVLCTAGAISLAIIYSISSHLPDSIQRSISWLPGIEIVESTKSDADSTVQWRLDLWTEAVRSIPDYFWIGQGFAYDGNAVMNMMSQSAGVDALQWALASGSYHNGWLSLLIVTGFPGLVFGLTLMSLLIGRILTLYKSNWHDPALKLCFQPLAAYCLISIATFFTVYGDVHASFPGIFFIWALIEALYKSDQRSSEHDLSLKRSSQSSITP